MALCPDDVHSNLLVKLLQSGLDISAVYLLYGFVARLLCVQLPLTVREAHTCLEKQKQHERSLEI